MADETNGKSRRRFIKAAGATTILAATASVANRTDANTRFSELEPQQEPTKPISPNDRLQIACIGVGGQGVGDTTQALKVPGVELIAVADVYDGRMLRAQETFGSGAVSSEALSAISIGGASTVKPVKRELFKTRDYREILARPDIDAVIIATPDHWHAKMAIDAMNAGKDVYLEKPMIHDLKEGKQIINAQNKSKRVCQVGSQRVSSIVYKKAKDLVASGAIGKITLVEAYWHRNSPLGAWQYSLPPDASVQNIDWDRFLGDAPKRPFDATRLFRWRNYRDYGTGIPGDLFVHLFSGINYVLNSNGPERIMATGGLRYWDDKRDVPDVMVGIYDYPKTASHDAFNLQLNVNFMDGGGGEEAFRFVGSDAVLSVLNNGVTLLRSPKLREPGNSISTFPKATQEAFLKEYRAKYPEPKVQELNAKTTENYLAPTGYSDHADHLKNWVTCIRTKQTPIEDAVFGFRAAGPAVLSNTSHFERKIYNWNPETMEVESS